MASYVTELKHGIGVLQAQGQMAVVTPKRLTQSLAFNLLGFSICSWPVDWQPCSIHGIKGR